MPQRCSTIHLCHRLLMGKSCLFSYILALYFIALSASILWHQIFSEKNFSEHKSFRISNEEKTGVKVEYCAASKHDGREVRMIRAMSITSTMEGCGIVS